MASIQKQLLIDTADHKNYEVILEEYNSAWDIANDCDKRPITDSRFHNAREYDNYEWRGVNNYQHALDLLKNGYVDKVDTIKKQIDKSVRGQTKRIKFSNDIVGYAPIVPLAIQGVPNSMINSMITPIKAKVLNICYNMSCYAWVDSEDIIRVGMAFLKVIASLEMQGYRFNLTALQDYSTSDYTNILKLNLKSANQPLDLKRVSFPMIHTGFFRVIGFDWYSKTPKGKHIYGYGKCAPDIFKAENEFKEFKEKVFGKNVVYIQVQNFVSYRDNELEEKLKEAIINECKRNNT